MHYIIYKITNLINGKIYIGKHKCASLDDKYFGSGKLLRYAINKYGIENFIFHVEIDLHSQEEMDLLETLVVNKDFLARDDVYNISRGGKNPCMYGDKNPFYGKKHTTELCNKISKLFKGIPLTDEHKQHISDSVKKKFHDNPELKKLMATTAGKKKCIDLLTGEIRFYDANNIPITSEIYSCAKPKQYKSYEEKLELNHRRAERCSKSKWYTDGITEIFIFPGNEPDGFYPGRLPTTNVGRKVSNETRNKIGKANTGKTPSNKGKIWITNGVINKYIAITQPLPDGWKPGITRHTKIDPNNKLKGTL